MPIWNCEKYVRSTLDSLIKQTKHKYELIMIDDKSTDFDGVELLRELKEIAYDGGFTQVITKVNKKQKYTNANWNKGVELATGQYIAIINSDIDFLTEEWDDYLIENLDFGYELANPYQVDRVYNEIAYAKAPFPDVQRFLDIRGACFMMSQKFALSTFPIPKQFIQWAGDNYIASKARDVIFDIRVEIYHHISKSGEKVDQQKFWTMVEKDVENWIEYSGDFTAEKILENCKKRLKQWKS
jgi:glycosyltransferase involved in cell wall biosynthesis